MSEAKTPRQPAHVQAAIDAAAQPKKPSSNADGLQLKSAEAGRHLAVPHVKAAIEAAQARPARPASPVQAPHVESAIGVAQARPAAPKASGPAEHVQSAIAKVAQAWSGPGLSTQERSRSEPAGPSSPEAGRRAQPMPPALHVQNAVQAALRGGGPTSPPPDWRDTAKGNRRAAFPEPSRVLQRMQVDDDEDFTVPQDVLDQIDEENDSYFALQELKKKSVKNQRLSKPTGLQDEMRKGLTKTDSGDEKEIYEKRIKKYKKTKYKSRPKIFQKSHYKAICRRCGKPIYFDQKYKELGVIHKNKKRKEAPLGHKLDYSTYKVHLASTTSKLLSKGIEKKKVTKWAKGVTWDRRNLGYEHYDCNATAPKITHKNITTIQDQKGKDYVEEKLKNSGFSLD